MSRTPLSVHEAMIDLINAINRAYINEHNFPGTWYQNLREEYNNAMEAVRKPLKNCEFFDTGRDAFEYWKKNVATPDDNKAENEQFNTWLMTKARLNKING